MFQFKPLLDEPCQAIYTFAQICIAAGDVEFIRAGKIVQHRRISATSVFSCFASHPE